MCYFHELLAHNVATSMGHNEKDPVIFSLAYVAANRTRITDVSPNLSGVMGRNELELASAKIQGVYDTTGLPRDKRDLSEALEFNSIVLRAGIENVVSGLNLTAESLNLPADSQEHIKFGNRAVDAVFVKPGPIFGINDQEAEETYQPLQTAVQTLLSNPVLDEAFRAAFHYTVANLIVAAPDKVDPKALGDYERAQVVAEDFSCCNGDVLGTPQVTSPILAPLPEIKPRPQG